MKKTMLTAALLAGVTIGAPAYAGVTLQFDTVTSTATNDFFGPFDRLIDQSGLSANYVNGATDFDSFVASTQGFQGTVGITSAATPFPINFDFGFAGAQTFDALAVYNQLGSASLREFDLFASNQADFSGATFLGSYEFLVNDQNALVATFGAVNAQYVRLTANSNFGFGSSVRFDEVIARSANLGAVPEPATWAFMIFGFGAIGGAMRRQRKANVKVSYA